MKVGLGLIGVLTATVTPALNALAATYTSKCDWTDSVVQSWAPMIVLVVVWVFFMSRYAGRPRPWQKEQFDRQRTHMERVEGHLEGIAAALERRSVG